MESCFVEALGFYQKMGPTESLVHKLQNCGLFLTNKSYLPIFYAERFAFILHSSSPLLLFGNANQAKEVGEKCNLTSKLSSKVSMECRKVCGISLLSEHLSKTGGWIPIALKRKESMKELKKALDACEETLNDQCYMNDMFENGMLKEVYGPSHKATSITLPGYIVRINAKMHKKATPEIVDMADEKCKELLKLSKEHTKEICTCIMSFVYCAKYYAAKDEFVKAFECFQEFFERKKIAIRNSTLLVGLLSTTPELSAHQKPAHLSI